MTQLFSHQDLPDDMLPRMYEMMEAAATVDLHWEVKTKALDFWEEVIWEHLRNQGMIDGAFPEVIFSKEHRKIVTLTKGEIQKRLKKVLSELSQNGCLGVLLSALQDGCDVEVVRRAVDVTKKVVGFLKKHKVTGYDKKGSVSVHGVVTKKFMDFVQQDLDKLQSKKTFCKSIDSLESVLDDIFRDQGVDKM